MEDNIILKSFSTSLKDDIKAISLAIAIGKQKIPKKIIILLSESKLYIMPDTISKVSFLFHYNCIKEIYLDEVNESLLKIMFDISKATQNAHLYQSLKLYIKERSHFLKQFICYYSAYYMLKCGILYDIPIKHTKIRMRGLTALKIKSLNSINSLCSDQNYDLIYKNNYSFLLFKGCFAGKDNSFEYKSNKACCAANITIKQYDIKSIDFLVKNENEMNLQSLLLKTILRYLHDQYWYSFIFIKFEDYIKKGNLGNDKSEWSGYRIDLRTSKFIPHDPIIFNENNMIINEEDSEFLENNKNYSFILLRRKYIPPFYDIYQDFVISLSSSYQLDNIPLPKVYNDLIETIAFSLHGNDNALSTHLFDYEKILLAKYEALLLDHDSLVFLSKNLDINGSICLINGMNYVYKLLFLIEQHLTYQPTFQSKIKSARQFLWIRMVEHCTNIIPNFSQDEYEKKLYHNDIDSLINEFSLVINTTGSIAYYNKYKSIWDKKIWKYYSYCLNGALTFQQFNYSHFVEFYLILKKDIKPKVFEAKFNIQFINLLNIDIHYYNHTKKSKFNSPFDMEILLSDSNTIITIDYDEDLFNLLLENCLLTDILSIEVKAYCLFIQKILQYTIASKIPLIKTLIKYMKSSTSKGLDVELKNFTFLIPHIVFYFNKISENPFLGIEAGNCLLEMISSSSDRENRIKLLKSGIIITIINCLKSPLQEVINISFQILSNLFEEIKNNLTSVSNFSIILEEIINVLTSTFVPGTYYQINIIRNGIEIFNVLLTCHQGIFQLEFNKLLEKIDFIDAISQYLLKSQYVLEAFDQKAMMRLENEIYKFISLYYEENPNWKLMELSRKYFDDIMNKTSQKYLDDLSYLINDNITEIGQMIIESMKYFLEAMLSYLKSNQFHLMEIVKADQSIPIIMLLNQLSSKITFDIIASLIEVVNKFKSILK